MRLNGRYTPAYMIQSLDVSFPRKGVTLGKVAAYGWVTPEELTGGAVC